MTDTNGWSKSEKFVFKSLENLEQNQKELRKEMTTQHLEGIKSINSIKVEMAVGKGEIIKKIEGMDKDIKHNSKVASGVTGGIVAIIISAIMRFVGLK